MLNVLHVICTQLPPGHFSARVGDSLWSSEEVVKISNCTFNAIMIIITIRILWLSESFSLIYSIYLCLSASTLFTRIHPWPHVQEKNTNHGWTTNPLTWTPHPVTICCTNQTPVNVGSSPAMFKRYQPSLSQQQERRPISPRSSKPWTAQQSSISISLHANHQGMEAAEPDKFVTNFSSVVTAILIKITTKLTTTYANHKTKPYFSTLLNISKE